MGLGGIPLLPNWTYSELFPVGFMTRSGRALVLLDPPRKRDQEKDTELTVILL